MKQIFCHRDNTFFSPYKNSRLKAIFLRHKQKLITIFLLIYWTELVTAQCNQQINPNTTTPPVLIGQNLSTTWIGNMNAPGITTTTVNNTSQITISPQRNTTWTALQSTTSYFNTDRLYQTPNVMTWMFDLGITTTSGVNTTFDDNIRFGYILCSTNTNANSTATPPPAPAPGNGYAVMLRNNQIELVRFVGGMTGTITTLTSATLPNINSFTVQVQLIPTQEECGSFTRFLWRITINPNQASPVSSSSPTFCSSDDQDFIRVNSMQLTGLYAFGIDSSNSSITIGNIRIPTHLTQAVVNNFIPNNAANPNLVNTRCTPVANQFDPRHRPCEVSDILSRPMVVQQMCDINLPNNACNCHETTSLIQTPHGGCKSPYCPELYAGLICSMVSADATFIQNAVDARYNWTYMLENGAPNGSPGTLGTPNGHLTWANRLKTIVDDINFAYDCTGKRRPVIQAGIFEGVEDEVENISISRREYDSDPYLRSLLPDTIPFPHYFSKAQICFSPPPSDNPDITKPEAKAWFYYQAKRYIDAGFTALHMGQIAIWAASDRPGLTNTMQIFDAIRNYAISKGSFVLLNVENPTTTDYWWKTTDPSNNNAPRYLTDFEARPLRPSEMVCVSGPISPCATQDGGCNTLYRSCDRLPECPLPSFIDPCNLNQFGGPVPTKGTSPLGCPLSEEKPAPTLLYYDQGRGQYGRIGECGLGQATWGLPDPNLLFRDSVRDNTPPNSNTNPRVVQVSSNACRIQWYQQMLCEMGTFLGGNAHLPIPGWWPFPLLDIEYPESDADKSPGYYSITDEPNLLNTIIGQLNANQNRPKPVIKLESKKWGGFTISSQYCNNVYIPPSEGYYQIAKSATYSFVHNSKDDICRAYKWQAVRYNWKSPIVKGERFSVTLDVTQGPYKVYLYEYNPNFDSSVFPSPEKIVAVYEITDQNALCRLKKVFGGDIGGRFTNSCPNTIDNLVSFDVSFDVNVPDGKVFVGVNPSKGNFTATDFNITNKRFKGQYHIPESEFIEWIIDVDIQTRFVNSFEMEATPYKELINSDSCNNTFEQRGISQVGNLNQIFETPSFKIYPNPSSNEIFIESVQHDQEGSYEVIVNNFLGQNIVQFNFENNVNPKNRIETAKWDNGLYFISILKQGKIIQTTKTVKMSDPH